jgi:hypothetical protein
MPAIPLVWERVRPCCRRDRSPRRRCRRRTAATIVVAVAGMDEMAGGSARAGAFHASIRGFRRVEPWPM